MGLIKNELNTLNETDNWGLILFALAKLKDSDEFSSVSELAYILDKKNLFRLCEYFGGTTITIPTIAELEKMIIALAAYEESAVQKINPDTVMKKLVDRYEYNVSDIRAYYCEISRVLEQYDLQPRGKI